MESDRRCCGEFVTVAKADSMASVLLKTERLQQLINTRHSLAGARREAEKRLKTTIT